jgi:hypothetical protein
VRNGNPTFWNGGVQEVDEFGIWSKKWNLIEIRLMQIKRSNVAQKLLSWVHYYSQLKVNHGNKNEIQHAWQATASLVGSGCIRRDAGRNRTGGWHHQYQTQFIHHGG